MSTNKALYGINNQAITITLNGLAAGAARCSLAVDNTSNLFLDALVQLKLTTGNATEVGNVEIFAYGTANGGSDYGDDVSGTDAAATLTIPPNLKLIGTMTMPNPGAANTVYRSNPMSVAAAFGGRLPDHWGIVVMNNANALNSSGCSAWYQGVQEQVV